MSGRRNLMIANSGAQYAPTDTVFDVTATENDLTHGMFLTGPGTLLDWGDGSPVVEITRPIPSPNTTLADAVTHTYAAPGVYTVRISGTYYWLKHGVGSGAAWPSGASRLATNIRHIGHNQVFSGMFNGCNKLASLESGCKFVGTSSPTSAFTSAGTSAGFELNSDFTVDDRALSLEYMFYASTLKSLPASFQFPASMVNGHYFCMSAPITSAPSGLKLPASCLNNLGLFGNNLNHLVFDISDFFPEEWAEGGLSINAERMFQNCKITGTAPASLLWESGNTFTGTANCFQGCTQLTNYSSIPSSWGGGGA